MTLKKPAFLLAVQMDVRPDHEALFNEVYDEEHIPALLRVPGVRSVRRFQRTAVLQVALGGAVQEFSFPHEPVFTTLYEIDSPEILTTAAWCDAVDQGRWSSDIRPFTTNRRHTLHRRMIKS